ncbi:hypothetical protein F4861DRAFT_253198 [Xylaria intraflava]|nr:hypothetical protein F4861DRAFT_253198 [Xylaria intraflava]
MIYCAYCGKGFSRKEHLERHLPTHTNVKPYHCEECHLGYSRRDLLQRHHLTYHVAKDPTNGQSGSMTPPGKKNQIACAHCATAKTGCDKQVPSCSRCRDKGIPCEIRYARRTARIGAIRKQRSATMPLPASSTQQALPELTAQPTLPELTPAMSFTSIEDDSHEGTDQSIQLGGMTSPGQQFVTITPQISPNGHCPSVVSLQTNLELFPSPSSGVVNPNIIFQGSPNGIFQFSNGITAQETACPDLWQPPTGYEIDPELFASSIPLTSAGPLVTLLPQTNNMASSLPSDSPNMSSYVISPPSMHTRTNSQASQSDPTSAALNLGINGEPAIQIKEDLAGIAAQFGWTQPQENPIFYSGTCPRAAVVHPDALEQDSRTWIALQQYMQQTEAGWDGNTSLLST